MSQPGAARSSLILFAVLLGSQFTGLIFAQDSSAGNAPIAPISLYVGKTISSIDFRSETAVFQNNLDRDKEKLLSMLQLHPGDVLTTRKLHNAIQTLESTGRFALIEAQTTPTSGNRLPLILVVRANYFIGSVIVEGGQQPPSASQLANATKLELGHLFDPQELPLAVSRIKSVMNDNGFFMADVKTAYTLDPDTQQANLTFTIPPTDRALVGQVAVNGDPGMDSEEVLDAAKVHPGNQVTQAGTTRALQRLRKKYQKQNRLEAQVSIAEQRYDAANNKVDYRFNIDRGPEVNIQVDGIKLRKGLIKKYIPVYEENTVDDDLLMEGARNLRDYLQTKGFFDAKATYDKNTDPASKRLSVIYHVDRGPRHKFTRLIIQGNKYFDEETIRERMQISTASFLFYYGRFSQNMLDSDVGAIQALYRSNGFLQMKASQSVEDDCNGQTGSICVTLRIDEGRQSIVHSLTIAGNHAFAEEKLRDPALISMAEGQPYSEINVATDRDAIASFYFERGFPDIKFEAFADPAADDANRINVRYVITEGTQQFVDRVITTGMVHTKRYVIDRELRVEPGKPLSQVDMLDTQRRLYDLGIFSEVNVAVQNPEGSMSDKNVLVQVDEAKRYTFTYGFGFEAQTGDTGNTCLTSTSNGGQTIVCKPQGRTSASPRVSFDVTRINFLGRDHTLLMKTVLGRIQQRGLVSYEAPYWFNNRDKTLTFTSFYDKTQDVNTFTAQRLEGSAQVRHVVNKGTTLLYRLTYRRVNVDASTLQVSPDQLPLLSKPVRVGFPSITFIRDTRDNPITSTRGTYTTADFSVASGIFGSQSSFTKLLMQNSTYYQLNRSAKAERRWVLARSTQVGFEEPFGSAQQSFLPLPERFYAGGANSDRGFGLNQAGPRDLVTGFPLGGGAVFVNNVELRTPPIELPGLPILSDNLSAAIFHDMGNVFDTPNNMIHNLFRATQPSVSTCKDVNNPNAGCDFNYVVHAVGAGLRYRTPIGPLRFDLGYTLNPTVFPVRTTTPPHFETLRRFNFVFSIGQTF